MNEAADAYSQLAVHHVPLYLKVMLGFGVATGTVAIGLGIWNLYGVQQVQAQATKDRIATEVASCERGNLTRKQLTDGFTSLASIPRLPPEIIDRLTTVAASMHPIDCQKTVITEPGSVGVVTTTTKGNP